MPEQSVRPVFFDADRRRWPWVVRFFACAALAMAGALGCLGVSIFSLPLLPHNALPRARELRDTGNADPNLNDRQRAKSQFVQRREKRRLVEAIADEKRRTRKAAPATPGQPVAAGFYVNWEETSRASLRRHIDELTHLFPEWLHISHDGAGFRDARTDEDRADVEPFVRSHHVPILPVLNNYVPTTAGSEQANWDTAAVHRLLRDPARRAKLIAGLRKYLLAHRWQGINVDFEVVPEGDRDYLTAFMRELYAAFHPAGLLVTQDIQLEEEAFDARSLARYADFLVPMFYDEHSPGDESGAGSIAGISWTREQLADLAAQVPASKLVMGLGAYAYDWKAGEWKGAAELSYQSAVVQAKESQDPKDENAGRIKVDAETLNPYYRYYDDDGATHYVWMLDATTAYNQMQVAKRFQPRGAALWCLGTEDPAVWSVIGRSAAGRDLGKAIDGGALDKISYGRQSEVDFEGEGELLDVVAQPNEGQRSIKRDAATGLITGETYSAYPSAYVVRRYGDKPKSVVLTFDDGPDPVYTPQILDVLKRYGVKATFFVVGKQAEENPALVARIWDEGHEIGNHTYTHPNLALTHRQRTALEITATQRVIESITGHSTNLFRPPYAIDVEPRTGGELKPIQLASEMGFISVGEKNDPQDWNLSGKGPHGEPVRRTAADIAESVWQNRDEGSIVLLHDGGGDRAATVAALPRIIERLRGAGYRFISLAQLRGVSRAALFPPVAGREQALLGVDRWVFEVSYLLQRALTTLFALSVALGVSRQLWMTLLALIQRRRERAAAPADAFAPPVSVLIAAYNEEKVIERTVRAVLASDYGDLEVIIVDDGSADGTLGVVRREFDGDGRVVCIRKENGGKASALNVGLTQSRGEIIVALDADTLFASDAISRLVRHFADPTVGAVAGNVKVGNPRNLLTKWQALEYVTSQNFDRRAYDLLNCITVVPGAVGAWRREAIELAGGYLADTLAEDTDLTWRVRRGGWRILNDARAYAYTEAPETLRSLGRQRFRWAFGTLQCLVKHRDAMLRYGAFGWVALPSLWVYQILFPAISPIMDVTVVWSLFAGSAHQVLTYYGLMVGIELLGAAVALRMDGGSFRLLPWLALQRFLYRQLMYWVILRSFVAAVRGGAVGWNKLDRRGTAVLAAHSATEG